MIESVHSRGAVPLGAVDTIANDGAFYRTVHVACVDLCRHGFPFHGQGLPWSCGHCSPLEELMMGYHLVPRPAAHIPSWAVSAFRRVFTRVGELAGEAPPFDRAWREYAFGVYPRVSPAECALALRWLDEAVATVVIEIPGETLEFDGVKRSADEARGMLKEYADAIKDALTLGAAHDGIDLV